MIHLCAGQVSVQDEQVPGCVLGDVKLKVYTLRVTTALRNKLQLSAASQCLVSLSFNTDREQGCDEMPLLKCKHFPLQPQTKIVCVSYGTR